MTESASGRHSARVSVRGEASLSVPPDVVVLSLPIHVVGASKAAALQAASDVLAALLEGLRSLGGRPLTVESLRSGLTWSTQSATTQDEVTYDRVAGTSTPTGRSLADVFVSVRLRDLGGLDRLQDVIAALDIVRIRGVGWEVDDDNPAWGEVRAAAIRAAIRVGRDYAAALGGALQFVEHVADSGLLGDSRDGPEFLAIAGSAGPWRAQSGGGDDVSPSPSLDPVPQELSATVEARFVATVGAIEVL